MTMTPAASKYTGGRADARPMRGRNSDPNTKADHPYAAPTPSATNESMLAVRCNMPFHATRKMDEPHHTTIGVANASCMTNERNCEFVL